MIIVLTKNNLNLDDTTDVSVNDIYVDNDVFKTILESEDLRNRLREELLKDKDSVAIGRIGVAIAGGKAFCVNDSHNNDKHDVSMQYPLEKELCYYAKL